MLVTCSFILVYVCAVKLDCTSVFLLSAIVLCSPVLSAHNCIFFATFSFTHLSTECENILGASTSACKVKATNLLDSSFPFY